MLQCIQLFDMLSVKNASWLVKIVLYKAFFFFLYLTLLFKLIWRSGIISDLYFCIVYLFNNVHKYTLLIFFCQSDFWYGVLYVRVEISQCLPVSIYQKQQIYATKIIYKL